MFRGRQEARTKEIENKTRNIVHKKWRDRPRDTYAIYDAILWQKCLKYSTNSFPFINLWMKMQNMKRVHGGAGR